MKIKYTLILGMLVFFSCKKQLDRTDLNSIAEYTIDYILNKDVESILKLTNHNNGQNEIEILLNKTGYAGLDNINRAMNIKFIRYEIKDNTMSLRGSYYKAPIIQYFFEIDNDYYQIIGKLFSDNRQYHYTSLNLKNLTYNCEYLKHGVYIPEQIILSQGYWFISTDKRSFKSFTIRGKNNTQNSIEELKFTLQLKNKSGVELFNKTINHKANILPDETFDISIPELTNYFVGFDISKSTFDFNTEVLSVEPKPLDDSCELLQHLK